MKNFLLILNGKVIADYITRGRAINAFKRKMLSLGQNDILSVFSVSNGREIAKSY